MSANHRPETLSQIASRGNVRARCGCGHVGVIDARRLSRMFFVRLWDTRVHKIRDHLRCSQCGARPLLVETTGAPPKGPAWGPKTEDDWKRLVRRLRG